MEELNKYFDKIYCINLDKRINKWEESVQEFKKHNIEAQRFSAINGEQLQGNGKISANELGCSLSHCAILREMINNNYSRILVLEDDAEFIDNVQEYFRGSLNKIPEEWDMLYLGGNHIEVPVLVNDSIVKISRTYTTSHYGITLEMAKKVVSEIEKGNEQVDVVYTKFQSINLCYCFHPPIAWQRPGFSDVQNSYQDYRYCMK